MHTKQENMHVDLSNCQLLPKAVDWAVACCFPVIDSCLVV